MVLHLTPEERAAYKREKGRQAKERYRARQASKAWQREERYRQIEETIAAVREENERIKSGYHRLREQYEELKNGPPRERIVQVEVVKEVPTVANVINLAAVLRLVREAPDHWRQELWAELEPLMRQFIKPECQ